MSINLCQRAQMSHTLIYFHAHHANSASIVDHNTKNSWTQQNDRTTTRERAKAIVMITFKHKQFLCSSHSRTLWRSNYLGRIHTHSSVFFQQNSLWFISAAILSWTSWNLNILQLLLFHKCFWGLLQGQVQGIPWDWAHNNIILPDDDRKQTFHGHEIEFVSISELHSFTFLKLK
jgi:hypothetical protein